MKCRTWRLKLARPRKLVKGTETAMEAVTVQRAYFKYEEAAQYTNLSPVTLWRAVRDGRLKAAGPGRTVRFHKDELDRFMNSRGR
jgi:excisionase family DNA binding protein